PEPSEVDADVPQPGIDSREREMLRAGDGDALVLAGAQPEVAHALCDPLVDEPAAPPGEALLKHDPDRRGSRPSARREPSAARCEVADVDAPGRLARLAQGQAAGEIARHPVVAERRQEPA